MFFLLLSHRLCFYGTDGRPMGVNFSKFKKSNNIFLSWIRIGIEKAVGSGSALIKTIGSGSAKVNADPWNMGGVTCIAERPDSLASRPLVSFSAQPSLFTT